MIAEWYLSFFNPPEGRNFFEVFFLKTNENQKKHTVGKRSEMLSRPLRPASQTRDCPEAARAEAQEARGTCEPCS